MFMKYYNLECVNCGYREEGVRLHPNEFDRLKCPRCKEKVYILKEEIGVDNEYINI